MDDREDLETLMNPLLEFAGQQQHKHGGFLPFGATLPAVESAEENIQLKAFMPEDEENTTAEEQREQLMRGLQGLAAEGSVRACALVTDVIFRQGEPDFPEAIHVWLEHSSGRALHCFLPYRQSEGGYEYSEPVFEPGAPELFAA